MASKIFMSSCCLVLIFLFLSNGWLTIRGVEGCSLAVIGGGCPDPVACQRTCAPCWRGVGQIKAFCQPAGGGIPYDQCICVFLKGAPCDPPGPPKCPGPPAFLRPLS